MNGSFKDTLPETNIAPGNGWLEYYCTRVSMVLSKWIITPIKVGCKSHK